MPTFTAISARALAYARSRAETTMNATCRIERVSKATFNQSTGRATAGTRTSVYEGPCRIWEITSQQPIMVGEEDIQMPTTQLSLPWDVSPLPQRKDQMEITAHPTDPEMVGQRFEIQSSVKAGDMRATRRFVMLGYDRT